MIKGKIKVIFDTNVWISFLIGKRLSRIKEYISNETISIITTNQLIKEIKEVTTREKLKAYFPQESVRELLKLLDIIAINVDIKPIHSILQDKKDNFLLDLIEYSDADYLVTGDKEILALKIFKNTTIITPNNFNKLFDN